MCGPNRQVMVERWVLGRVEVGAKSRWSFGKQQVATRQSKASPASGVEGCPAAPRPVLAQASRMAGKPSDGRAEWRADKCAERRGSAARAAVGVGIVNPGTPSIELSRWRTPADDRLGTSAQRG